MLKKTQFIKDLKEKDFVESPFLIKFSSTSLGKNGKPFMNLVLMDKTGEMEARIWDDVQNYTALATKGAVVWVDGRCQNYQGRKQVVVSRLQILREEEFDLKDYLAESSLDSEGHYQALIDFIQNKMKDPYYRGLAEAVFIEDQEVVSKIKKAPAAKSVHHAYQGGLLEHILSITKILEALADHYGTLLDRDLLFLGGFFHDIGKIWELSYDRATDYTTEGKLVGHLVMGVELVERKIQELDKNPGRLPGPFPVDKKLLVKHLILAHHGKLEYGSPKEPHCLEALVVHMVDDLDSKVNAISQFIQSDLNPGRWTALNRNMERFFYKPDWAVRETV